MTGSAMRRHTVKANGLSFALTEFGKGPAVLFCHGFPDTSETWTGQMRAVAAAGYRAIALDMRGYGSSDAPADPEVYTSLHISGDLIGVLDALDIPSAVLVGHDWGAEHVWQAILKRPDRFRAAVGISVPYSPRGDLSLFDLLRQQPGGERYYMFDFLKADAEVQWAPAARTIPAALYWGSASPPPDERWDPFDPAKGMTRSMPAPWPDWADPEYVAHQVRAFERTGFRGGLNYYRAMEYDFELTAAYRDAVIPQPTLYVFGTADGLHKSSPVTAKGLRRVLPGLTDYVALENVGHWVQHEAGERLNAAILRFLRELEPPAR